MRAQGKQGEKLLAVVNQLKDEALQGMATGAFAPPPGTEWDAVNFTAPVKDLKDMLDGTAKVPAAWRKNPGDPLSGSPPTKPLLLPAAGGGMEQPHGLGGNNGASFVPPPKEQTRRRGAPEAPLASLNST